MASQEQNRFESSITNSKGKQLYARYWYKDDWRKSSDKEPKALLLLLHGLCEHCLWYNEMAEFLNAQGIYVYAHDHVGHGQSEGSRVYVEKFQEYVDDSILHAEKMKKEYPDVPMFVHGHSMGGLITILLMNQRPDLFKGAILNGPLITLDNLPPGFVVWLGRMVSTIFPHFPARKLDSKGVSRDAALVKRYEEDPLVHRGALKCGQVATMMDAMATVVSSLANIDWPFLILHSEIDELTSVEGSKLMYEKAKSKDKYLKLFSEGFHMLHGELEPIKSETLNLIASWITERSTNQTS